MVNDDDLLRDAHTRAVKALGCDCDLTVTIRRLPPECGHEDCGSGPMWVPL